jgi:hypothetical protein
VPTVNKKTKASSTHQHRACFLSFIFLQFFVRYFLHLHFKCYPESPLYLPQTLLPYPPTPASWPWHSPVLRHKNLQDQGASLPNDGWLGHLLLHMQLETRALGVLISSYCTLHNDIFTFLRFCLPMCSVATIPQPGRTTVQIDWICNKPGLCQAQCSMTGRIKFIISWHGSNCPVTKKIVVLSFGCWQGYPVVSLFI